MAFTFKRVFNSNEFKRKKLIPYCYSETCASGKWKNRPTILNVKQTEDFCPNCKSAIYWGYETIENNKKENVYAQ